jgi:hypothetical protein
MAASFASSIPGLSIILLRSELRRTGVRNRGDRREPIFKDDPDRQRFLETLGAGPGENDGGRVVRRDFFLEPTLRVTAIRQPVKKQIPISSEILFLTDTQFLVIERDNLGLASSHGPEKKCSRIYLASLEGATNLQDIEGKPFSRDAGDAKGIALNSPQAAERIKPASKTLLVDMLDPRELKKAGFTDLSKIPEKWEGMALISHESLPANQYLLLVGVDNDFRATDAFVKTTAQPDGAHMNVAPTTETQVPTLLFIYRVELPQFKGASSKRAMR